LPNYYGWIASHFAARARHGARARRGRGLVVKNYLDRVDKVIAVDINRELLSRLERTLPREKVRALEATCAAMARARGVTADCVIALDVVEHFQDDARFVEKMKSCCGRAEVDREGPAQTRLYGDMDRASGTSAATTTPTARADGTRGLATIELRHMNPVGAWGYRFKKEKKTNFSKTFSPLS
jgi:hypothetical protein